MNLTRTLASLVRDTRKLATLAAVIFLLSSALVATAFAAEETEHEAAAEPHGIPISVVYQTINFAIFVGLGFYFLRKPVHNFFTGRRENFRQALVKAEHAKREAEMRKNEIQEKLTRLEASTQATLAEARAEADALRSRILREANDLSQNFRDEAMRTVQAEVERAKAELRDEVLSQSVAASKRILTEKMTGPDQTRLQNEFLSKIGGEVQG